MKDLIDEDVLSERCHDDTNFVSSMCLALGIAIRDGSSRGSFHIGANPYVLVGLSQIHVLNLKLVTRSPPIGLARQTALPLNFKLSADILCHHLLILRQNVTELFDSLATGHVLRTFVQHSERHTAFCLKAPRLSLNHNTIIFSNCGLTLNTAGFREAFKGQLTLYAFYNVLHYVGTSFRTESCVILNKLNKIFKKSCVDAGEKNKS